MPEERGLYRRCRVGDQLEYFAVLHGAPHGQARDAARSWLDRLGLRDREGARVEELSQGNQQRVQLAAALVHHPDLLILDEPFAGLDPIVTDLLTEVLREEAARGVPVLFSSHQLELVEHICESVAIIDRGRLVACGKVDELRAGGPRLVRIDVRGRRRAGSTRSLTSSSWSAPASGPSCRLAPAADPQRILDAARRSGIGDALRRAAADACRAVPRAGVAMTARRAVWEVARRELVERSRSRTWRVTFVLLLILCVGGAIAAARVSSGTPSDDVGLVGARAIALQPAIRLQAQAAGRRVRLHPLASTTAASRALRDGTIDVALLDGGRLLVKRSPTTPAVRVVQDAIAGQAVLDRLRSSGLSEARALSALAPRALPVQVLEPRGRSLERNRDLLYVGLLVLYIALVGFGNAVATSVTEEKSSRVVELLLTTLSPRRLLAGKVLGVGLLGLAQLLLAGGAALAAGQLAGGAGLPSAAPEAVALVLLWFVLGYAFYSVAYAAVGALVSRQEDLAGATTLLTTRADRLLRARHDRARASQRDAGYRRGVRAAVRADGRACTGGARRHERARAPRRRRSRPPRHRRTDPARRARLRASDPAHRRAGQAAPRARKPNAPSRDRGPRHRRVPRAQLRSISPWAGLRPALILAGAVILITRLSEPVAIALIALGLLLKAVRESGKRGPRNAAR